MQDKVNSKNNTANDVIEIDLSRIWKAICHRIWLVLIASVLCVVITLVGTFYLVTPEYESSAMFYVNNNSLSVGDTSFSISSGDITAAKSLVDTYIVILNSRACLNDVIDYADIDISYSDLKNMISASAVNDTEVFEIVVTSEDPAQAEKIANAIAYILPKRISSIVEGTSANIVDYAIESSKPSSPNYPKNALVGFMIGFVISIIYIVVRELFDVTIRTQEDIERCSEHPVLAQVPDMLRSSEPGGDYYGYGSKKPKKQNAKHVLHNNNNNKVSLVGKNISFAASEAYKMLRTKLQFSFVDEITCPIIGVSSALAGEGKSLSSVNLAYSLAQLDKRVLLIDCDMRRPSLSTKLPISKVPGLSNYLTGQKDKFSIIQHCEIDTDNRFDVVSSGDNPPNPIELISSKKMEKILNELREEYDYIIVDLPPVGEVSDAMAAAKLVDGMLIVVRQDYCNTVALSTALNQFEFIEAKILGVVMNCVGESGGRYSRYGRGYYSKYSKYSKYAKYSRTYASAYEKASKRAIEESNRRSH